MDFSMLRPKPPAKKPEPPPPQDKPPTSHPPPAKPEARPPPPPEHQEMAYPPHGYGTRMGMGPYMDELDRASHMHRLRSMEYTNARTWRVNFGGHSDEYYYDNTYEYGPSRGHQPSRYTVAPPTHSHDRMLPAPRLGLPPPDHHHGLPGPPPRLGLPPPDHHHGLPGPPPRLGPPPPDYHHGFQGPPPPYYHSQPHYGYFSDENPNGCTVM